MERFLRLIEGGCPLADMAKNLGRSENDVAYQAQFLGVQLPQHEALPVSTSTADSSIASTTVHYAPFPQTSRSTSA